MPLLLTLNICRIWFYCYYCLIRTNKCWLSLKKFFFNVFSNRWKYIALWPRKFAVLHVFFFIHPVKGYKRINFHIYIYIYIYIYFHQGWNCPSFVREPQPPPLSFPGYPFLSEANLKSYLPLSQIHRKWCMQIVRNTLKWRCYVSYHTKSIKNIINIALFTFRLNFVFTTDTFFC